MGRIDFVLNDDVEIKFRKSFANLKKGDISKKIESLICADLKIQGKEEEKENKKIKKITTSIDQLILNLYRCDELSLIGANKVALEWDLIKQKIIV